ncbi:MAG: GNAT family N-acetyltransferase [Candidatus Dormibacteraceae bacterium]
MDLVGASVRLRAAEPGDAVRLATIVSDPRVAVWGGIESRLPVTEDRIKRDLTTTEPGRTRWVIDSREDGVALGSATIFDQDFRNRHAWFAIYLGPPERWGRGYGSEATRLATDWAFSELGMAKVYLQVLEDNQHAISCYRRAGFEVEAVLPRDHLLGGRFVTGLVMAAYPAPRSNPSPSS